MTKVIRQAPLRHSLILLGLISGCSTLQTPALPDNLATLATEVASGDSSSEQAFVDAMEGAIRMHERNGELHRAVQLAASGLKALPDNQRLESLFQSMEAQLATARLHLQWEKLIGETRQQLTQQELLRSESKLQPPSSYRDWQLERLEKSIQANAEKLRLCAQQSLENKQWHYTEDCIALAININGDTFVSEEQKQLNASKATSAATSKTTNTLQERRLSNAFDQALKLNNLSKARSILYRLQQMNTTTISLPVLEQQLTAAINRQIEYLAEKAAEYYRNQDYQMARSNWQSILKLDPDHPEATERLKRVDKVLQSLEELQSGADKP